LATAIVATILATSSFAQVLPRRAAPADPAAPAQPRAVPGQPRQRVTANRPESASAQMVDRQIATLLGICNQEEVELARIAGKHSKNDKVREFADTLSKAHGDHLAQLQQFGAQSIALRNDGESRPATDRDPNRAVAESQPGAAQTRTAGNLQGGLDFLAVKRQVAQMCIDEAQKQWSDDAKNKDGECDMAFVGAQIVGHQQMLNEQKVLRQYASPELQVVIDKGIQATEDHLAQAKDLIHKLDRESDGSDSK